MRTKTLLIAAAALAAVVTSSQAQSTVYSQNIVGYVNQTFATAGASYFLVAPLTGPTNTAQALMSSLQSGDTVLIWNGNGYNVSYYIGPGNGNPAGQDWDDVNFNPTTSPTLSPGQGFFFQTTSGLVETNTWVGNVQLTNSIALNTAGGSYSLGSTPPVAGAADDTNTINLPVVSGDTLLLYNGNGYNTFYYIGPGNGNPVGQNWDDVNFNPITSPTITVGQGFFYQTTSGGTETWKQNLVIQ